MYRYPLSGIRVLEICEGFAGPWAASLLGDLGAEVLKVEAIQRMDQTRGPASKGVKALPEYPKRDDLERPWNANLVFVSGNRNKRSITLDISRPKGLALFKDLVLVSDVVLTNMVTGVPQRLGIDYPSLRKARPDLIVLTSCGFGSTGPYAERVAMAGSTDAVSGHTFLRTYEGEPITTASYTAHLDTVTGAMSTYAVLTALYHRAETGQGQYIDLATTEAFMPHIGEAIMGFVMNGEVATSLGNAHPFIAPHGCYPCRGEDRWIAIAVETDSEWEALRKVIGNPSWAADNRFGNVRSRWQSRKELDEHIGAWTKQYAHRELMELLQKAGVTAGAVLDGKDITEDPHLRERGFYQEVEQRDMGRTRMQAPVWKMSATPLDIHLPPPPFAGDNGYVFSELLGVGDDTLSGLKQERYIGTEPLAEAM